MELIDKEAIVQDLLDKSFYPAIVRRAIEQQPVIDAVEVIRCKDCEAYQPTEGGKPFCVVHQIAVCADDFCAYGKRRESEGT